MHTIANLVASSVSTATDRETCIRAMSVAQRAISRLPNEDTTLMPGICSAYNAAYLSSAAICSRTVDIDIPYALRCESARDRLLETFGL